MTAPILAKQKTARTKLDSVFADAANTWVIHYSCESFYDRPNGASPRITSIAVRRLDSGQTLSFSIHQVAEERGIPFDQIEAHYDDLERKMLDAFYQHVGSHKGMKYVHWNMRDINYGFAAIEHRHRVLKGAPVIVEDDKKTDLARLLIDIYGVGYIGHPRLENLLARNSIKPRDFLTGPQEAEAFERRNFVGLHQSTLRKVDVIANLAERAHSRQLRTNTTWWEMHGGRLRAVTKWTVENKTVAFLASLATFIGLGIAIYTLR
ncbi:MAG: hypothetical protein J0I21_11730 [Alphaproteobacteria bacterium]|nr:hypothetical protein [Alphaproteobacteria bacterium]